MKDADWLRLLEAAADPDPSKVLEALVSAAGAGRGMLLLRDGGVLRVRCARGEASESPGSRTLLDRAVREQRPLRASDADLEGIGSLRGRSVRSVCALPLRLSDGAVYLEHPGAPGLFDDLERLDAVARRLDQALAAARRREGLDEICGASAPMQALFRLLERCAASPYPVLVRGESGTGKELVARALHRRSPRASGPFVAANCAVLPETLADSELFGHVRGAFTGADRPHAGLFEQAHGGTLFLDEIACLPATAQEAMLRVLETGEVRRLGGAETLKVDVRIVAATHEDLEHGGSFRKDLFYRLDVLRLDLPPLRDRKDDLPLLVERILDRVAQETRRPRKTLGKAALAVLLEHDWPGNVRELVNALRRAASLADGDVLAAADFAFLKPAPGEAAAAPLISIDEHIRRALAAWTGKLELQEIADRLGISRKTLWEKKKKWEHPG
jgi:DNA-binding NtrC family response regulator